MSTPWPKVRLAELLSLRSPDVQVTADRDYQFAGVKSFGGGVFRSVIKSGSSFAYKEIITLRENDLVYPKLMAWEGAVGLVQGEEAGLVVSPEFCVFEIDRDRAVPRWLELYFRLPSVWPLLAGGSAGTNVRRRRIYPREFLAIEVPLPPLTEQRRVVAEIEEIESRVRDARFIRGKADDDSLRMLRAAFDSIVRSAPRKAMSEVAPLVRRPVEVDALATYPELGIRSFGHGTFHKPAISGLEVGSKRLYRIEAGDLVFSNVFAWEGAIAVARAADAGRYGSHRFITCVPVPDVATSRSLCFYFLTPEGLESVGHASPGGAGRNRTLGLEALGEIQVPVPPIERQHWFDGLQDQVDSVRQLQKLTAVELDALVPSVVARAFQEKGAGQ